MFSPADAHTDRPQPEQVRAGQVPPDSEQRKRENGFEKTLADTFPASDPPSTIPDPCLDDEQAA